MLDIAARLDAIRADVAAAARRAGRDAADVTIVAVTKGFPAPTVEGAAAAGLMQIGENRVQELIVKQDALLPAVNERLTWHLIGQLQSNKARQVAPRVALIHSVDRFSLVAALARVQRAPPVLLEVNVSGEAQKAGVAPAGAGALLEACLAAGLRVTGLMTVAPLVEDAAEVRPVFAALRELRDALAHPHVRQLSMGMSDDYAVAVEEGATIIRLGRAIFGPRRSP